VDNLTLRRSNSVFSLSKLDPSPELLDDPKEIPCLIAGTPETCHSGRSRSEGNGESCEPHNSILLDFIYNHGRSTAPGGGHRVSAICRRLSVLGAGNRCPWYAAESADADKRRWNRLLRVEKGGPLTSVSARADARPSRGARIPRGEAPKRSSRSETEPPQHATPDARPMCGKPSRVALLTRSGVGGHASFHCCHLQLA